MPIKTTSVRLSNIQLFIFTCIESFSFVEVSLKLRRIASSKWVDFCFVRIFKITGPLSNTGPIEN